MDNGSKMTVAQAKQFLHRKRGEGYLTHEVLIKICEEADGTVNEGLFHKLCYHLPEPQLNIVGGREFHKAFREVMQDFCP